MDLSVIILNWNTRDLLEACLHSLLESRQELAFQVIVVDNASEDDSREMVQRLFPSVQLLVNPVNLGFGAGNNTAVSSAKGRYLLFLNTDTVVTDNALADLVQYADSHPDIGIAGPKLLNGDGSLQFSCRRFPNLATGLFRNTPLGRLLPGNRPTSDYLYQDWDHMTPRDVEWLSGAAMLIRRQLADQIGCFDEDFFMYCEDVDLCWRASHAPLPAELASSPISKSGSACWRVVYFPDSVIYHYIGRSSDQVPARMTYEFHRSQYLFYRKHYAASFHPLLRPLVLPGIALRGVGQIIRYRINYWKRRLTGEYQPRQPQKPQGGAR